MKELKKLKLSKEKFYELNSKEQETVKGGFFKSRALCTQTKADADCTKHTRCGRVAKKEKEDEGGLTLLCIEF